MTQVYRPLLFNMKHVFLDELRPIPDKSLQLPDTSALFLRISTGTMHPEDYSTDMWKELYPVGKSSRSI
jgi:hypothetical protein